MSETQEVITTKKEFACIKKGYRSLGPAIKNYTDAQAQEAAKGEVIADALHGFAETQTGALGNILKTTSHAQRKMDHSLGGLGNITKDAIAGPILEKSENEIKKISAIKKKQSMARVKYDAAMNDLLATQKKNDIEKIQKAQLLCIEAKQVYDTLTAEFLEAAHALQNKVQSQLGQQFKEYASFQLEYFQKGVEVWQAIVKHLDQGI